MAIAAQDGIKNIDIIEYYISKDANFWDWAMRYATNGGHQDLVEYFIDKGANDFTAAIERAKIGDQTHLIKFFQDKMLVVNEKSSNK